MTHVRALTAGLIITLVAAATSTNVSAQTTAPGAYYAPPAWSQTLPASTRFIVLSNFNSEAVLDRETGLVWQRAPTTFVTSWFGASRICLEWVIGTRTGWRLPTASEFSSLLDASQQVPTLPANHPFTNVVGPYYWTSSEDPEVPGYARVVDVTGGWVLRNPKGQASSGVMTWCVRGQSGQ